MKTRLLLVLLLGLLVLPNRAQTAAPDSVQPLPKITLHIGKATLETEIASTREQQERGLMYRQKLGDNEGMIFLLPTVTTATFWMKNTLIPLSIAFLDKNGVILEIHDMKARDETITRSESNQVAYALETNLHWFALNGIKPGDKVMPPPGTLAQLGTFAQPETPVQKANRERVEKKLKSLVIDKFNFDQLDSQLVMDYLTKRSKELDPEHIGIQFTILTPTPSSSTELHREGSGLADIPLSECVRYICAAAHLQYRIEGNAVVFFRSPTAIQN